jgi:hypothetical protein
MMYDGAPIMGSDYGLLDSAMMAPAAEQQVLPAVQPMTQEAVPDYNSDLLSTLRAAGMSEADLVGLSNFSGFAPQPTSGGGLEGLNFGLALPADYKSPYGEVLITAPTSNKGNPTAYGANNQFYMYPDNFVRVVDRSTNSVVFEGTGIEAAREAVKIGQNLTDTMGRKADYQIQTGNTQDNYQPVANERFNKSTVGKIANVVGTVAPLAMALIPGANIALLGSKVAGGIAAGALLGGASAGLKGDNILKGAAMGGLSAAGGQVLGPVLGNATGASSGLARAVGTGIGATAGGLATGQSLENSLLGGAISGGLSYVAPSIQRDLGIGAGSGVNIGSGGTIDPSIINVLANASIPTAVNVGGGSNSTQPKVQDPYDSINVTGNKFGNLVNAGVGNIFGAPTGPVSAFDQYFRSTDPAFTNEPVPTVEEPGTIVTGMERFNPTELLAALGGAGALAAATAGNVGAGSNGVDGAGANDGYVDPETGDIVVSKYRPINPPGGFDPIAFAAATGLPIGSILESLGALNPPPADPALMQPETLPEDIVVSGRLPTTTPSPIPGFATAIPAVIPGALTAAQTSSTPPGNGGVLGTGLTIPQLLSIGGVGADLLQSLLAGGGGGGAGTPYTSPFGTGAGFAPRQDMRVNPNILDYERYGFGPEAMFFRPEYSGLLPANAAPAQAPPAMTINPAYMPLI